MLLEKFFKFIKFIKPQKINKPLSCHYAVSGIDYKNGFVTTCAIQTNQLHKYKSTTLPSKFINNPNLPKRKKPKKKRRKQNMTLIKNKARKRIVSVRTRTNYTFCIGT